MDRTVTSIMSRLMASFTKLFLWIGMLALANVLYAQTPIPEHGAVWVHDEAGILSTQTKAQIEAALKYERDSTSNQIAVLIVPSVEGGDIDGYAVQVFEKWKLGMKGKDNGVLFLISVQDRQMRIEVGYGLEGVLTDAMSSRINRNEVAPRFRQGDYDNGVKAGVSAIIQTIKGEYKNENPPQQQRRKKKGSPLVSIIIFIIIIIIASRRRGGGGGGSGWSDAGGFLAGTMMGGRGFGGSGGSWGGGGDFGGGGGSGGGGSSDSW